MCCYLVILYFSSGSKVTSTPYRLTASVVNFIVLLLGILFYVDNIYIGYWDAGSMMFPVFILLRYLAYDQMYFLVDWHW